MAPCLRVLCCGVLWTLVCPGYDRGLNNGSLSQEQERERNLRFRVGRDPSEWARLHLRRPSQLGSPSLAIRSQVKQEAFVVLCFFSMLLLCGKMKDIYAEEMGKFRRAPMRGTHAFSTLADERAGGEMQQGGAVEIGTGSVRRARGGGVCTRGRESSCSERR
ncbi:hypothetical protein MRB53_034926 [Persea americana]|uniref:Uncharacterized protein n=1 Tax=Persea americana TaxID=3435 RepID=A0ACC2K3F5_PERAE|nr:hypothetical protein MRB53_034926 [Persea americana]